MSLKRKWNALFLFRSSSFQFDAMSDCLVFVSNSLIPFISVSFAYQTPPSAAADSSSSPAGIFLWKRERDREWLTNLGRVCHKTWAKGKKKVKTTSKRLQKQVSVAVLVGAVRGKAHALRFALETYISKYIFTAE